MLVLQRAYHGHAVFLKIYFHLHLHVYTYRSILRARKIRCDNRAESGEDEFLGFCNGSELHS